MDRKGMKKAARMSVKKHYVLFLLLCLLTGLYGIEFTDSLNVVRGVVNYHSGRMTAQEAIEAELNRRSLFGITRIEQNFFDILVSIREDRLEEQNRQNLEAAEEYARQERENTILGRSRGVFSSIVNRISSGAFLSSLMLTILSIVKSKNLMIAIMILGAGLIFAFIGVFFFLVLKVIARRMYLEGRIYERVSIQRSIYLLKIHMWTEASLGMLVWFVYQFLWDLTIVGGIIKHFSYYMVPYIIAENPGIGGRKAIDLSRKMMYGHKWECFVFSLSFIGWSVLDALTLGISGIVYSNPYRNAAFCEYYVYLRGIAIDAKLPGSELLNDRYLFEAAPESLLQQTYADILQQEKQLSGIKTKLEGFRGFLSRAFGITLFTDAHEKKYQESQQKLLRLRHAKEAAKGQAYPERLGAIPLWKREIDGELNYLRNYSVFSLILIFFFLCFGGWAWEVCLHLISDGVFVNRGVMHGPWLPIYGAGSLMLLMFLNPLRRIPILEFLFAVVLCGILEYTTSYCLEIYFGGIKWWDYTGYFINLHGRICAEGLLVFGIGGMAVVYMIAPILDNLIRRIPFRVLLLIDLLLISLFLTDLMYSKEHPNTGKGISDYIEVYEEEEYETSKTSETIGSDDLPDFGADSRLFERLQSVESEQGNADSETRNGTTAKYCREERDGTTAKYCREAGDGTTAKYHTASGTAEC